MTLKLSSLPEEEKLAKLKELHDKAYTFSQETRERAAQDLYFYWISHWDDDTLEGTNLAFRGQFDIIRPAGRKILSNLDSNPIQNEFAPEVGTPDEMVQLVDGMYRTGDNKNTALFAYETAAQEAVVCGVGAWELYTAYITDNKGNKKQVVKRRAIPEANNVAYWDPNAKEIDKSDGIYLSLLSGYTEDGYIKLVKDLTGEDVKSVTDGTFKAPETSFNWFWENDSGKVIYVTRFYYSEKITEKLVTLHSEAGSVAYRRGKDIEKEAEADKAAGFVIVDEKDVERHQVTLYIASGEKILSETVISGQYIPVIPQYGEYAHIDGTEHYEGIVKLAQDPQMVRNFSMSYIADILSMSPRPMPIWYQEQIAGHEADFAANGADRDLPYYLVNMVTGPDGKLLPPGPVALMPEYPIPPASMTLLAETRNSVMDVANSGGATDSAVDVDLSGKALRELNNRVDMQSTIYQTHAKYAKRRDGQVWMSMVSEISDIPRSETVTLPDGTRKTENLMETAMNKEGKYEIKNDLHNAEFEVYSKIGMKFSTKQEQTLTELKEIYQHMDPADPLARITLYSMLTMIDGATDAMRDYVRMEMIYMEIEEPDTDEEKQKLAAKQQEPQEPTAEMALAQAEQGKADAEMVKAQTDREKAQAELQINAVKLVIANKEADTKRLEAITKAKEAGVTINKTLTETQGINLDNILKAKEIVTPKETQLTG